MFQKIVIMRTFKILSIICFAVLGSVSCGSQKNEVSAPHLHPVGVQCPPRSIDKDGRPTPCSVDKDGKPLSGYIDENGRLVINAQFDWAGEFNGGLAPVRVDGAWGYINEKGEFTIQPKFDYAENFYIGDTPLAVVGVGKKYGYIDPSGNFVINPQFNEAGSFTRLFANSLVLTGNLQTFAKVKVGDKWGFIDSSGNYVINPQYDAAGNFSEGLALVKVGNLCGYIDGSGKMAIALQFECTMSDDYFNPRIADVGDFSPWRELYSSYSLARVKKIPGLPVLNKIETKPHRVVMSGFADDNSKYGYIDRTGKFVIEPQFNEARDFSYNGMAVVGFAQELTVLFDNTETDEESNKTIQERNKNQPPLKEGIVRVVKWGVINETGRIIINPIFDNIGNFSEGLASVTIGGKCGYIDETGKYVIEPKFAKCGMFSHGIADVTETGNPISRLGTAQGMFLKKSVIDKTGKIIFTYFSE
jgi:hypothetical protein